MTALAGTGTAPIGHRRSTFGQVVLGARTTPGRLQLMLAGLLGLAVLAGLLGALAAAAARGGTRQVATATEPLLVNAEIIYTSLADADATAAQAFLAGGLPPPPQTLRYRADVDRAGGQLVQAAARAGSAGAAADDVHVLATELPVYTGLVEDARANNRQGLPVGAAYLARASALSRSQLLPAAGRLFALEQGNLAGGYGSARAAVGVGLAGASALALLGVLVAVQVALYRRTHRVLNLPLVGASLVTVALAVALAGVFAVQYSRLSRAQTQGSDPIGTLTRARIAALTERGDEVLTLVGRGEDGGAHERDFTSVQGQLVGGSGSAGLLGDAVAQAGDPGQQARVADAQAAARAYGAVHQQLAQLNGAGQYDEAVTSAIGGRATGSAAVFARLDNDLTAAIGADQDTFGRLADSAGSGLAALTVGAPVAAAAAGVLALVGVRARLREYR